MPARHELVNLYYLGGLSGETGKQAVTARQRAFIVPPVGEYVKLQAYLAQDVMRRYPNVFTTNADLARRITGQKQNYRAPYGGAVSIEELEAQLAEMKALKVIEEEGVSPEKVAKRQEQARAKLEAERAAAEAEAEESKAAVKEDDDDKETKKSGRRSASSDQDR